MNSTEVKPLTITKLSKRLGVSIATISAVLNNRHKERRIAPHTVERIQQAVQQSGYRPNISARRLRSRHINNMVIAIITSFEAPLPVISTTLSALQKVTAEKAYKNISVTVTMDMFHAGQIKNLQGLLDGSRFNGAIIANTIPADDQFFSHFKLPMPVVFIGREIPNYSSVRELNTQTGKKAADILFASGSQKPVVIHGKMMTQTTQGRVQGFIDTVTQISGQVPNVIIADNLREKDGYDALLKYITENHHLDGLFSVTDSLAVGAYAAFKKKGIRIPDDVTVIGTGDYSVSEYLDPPLSTFIRSIDTLHEEAIRLLLRLLTGEITQPTQIVIPVIPVLRESTKRGSLKG